MSGAPTETVLLAAALGVLIAASNPLYYWFRLSRLAPLSSVAALSGFSLESVGAVLWDPNIGLLFNDPWLPLAVTVVLAACVRRAWRPDVWHGVAAVSAVAVLRVRRSSISTTAARPR